MVADGQKQVCRQNQSGKKNDLLTPTVAVVLHFFHFSDKSGNMFELLDASQIRGRPDIT